MCKETRKNDLYAKKNHPIKSNPEITQIIGVVGKEIIIVILNYIHMIENVEERCSILLGKHPNRTSRDENYNV